MNPVEPLSLDTLRAELAQLELRIVDRITAELQKKADRTHVEAIERDLEGIKSHGSPALIGVQQALLTLSQTVSDVKNEQASRAHFIEEHIEMRNDVSVLKTFRTRAALIGTLSVLAIPPATALMLHYL